MGGEPWKDQANYQTGRIVKCLGCKKECHKTKWGSWCFKCNVERIARINRQFDALMPSNNLDSRSK